MLGESNRGAGIVFRIYWQDSDAVVMFDCGWIILVCGWLGNDCDSPWWDTNSGIIQRLVTISIIIIDNQFCSWLMLLQQWMISATFKMTKYLWISYQVQILPLYSLDSYLQTTCSTMTNETIYSGWWSNNFFVDLYQSNISAAENVKMTPTILSAINIK